MRLTDAQRTAIREAAQRCLGVPVRLFGSRVDDSKRGGDIDLYVELPGMPSQEAWNREREFSVALMRALGERKIDIVVNTGALDLAIYRVAQEKGQWV